jgi:hypothetical protein
VAQAGMLFPKLPRLISDTLVMPVYLLHRIWWKLGYIITHSNSVNERNRILIGTGAFTFIAHKGEKE